MDALTEAILQAEGANRARLLAMADRAEPDPRYGSFWARALPLAHPKDRCAHWTCPETLALRGSNRIKVFNPSIRSSAFAMLASCPRKFLYRYRLGIKPRGAWSSALGTGKAFHKMMEGLMAGMQPGAAVERAAQKAAEAENELIEMSDTMGLLPGGQPVQKAIETMRKDLQLARVMAAWTWSRKPFDLDKWEVLALEVNLETRYQTLRQPIRMKLDALIRRKGTPYIYIADWKTCSGSPIARAVSLRWEIQPIIYRLGVLSILADLRREHNEPNLELRGFIHVIVQKPSIRQTAKETWEDYLERVGEWYSKRFIDKPEDPPYFRSVIKFTKDPVTLETLARLRTMDRACTAKCDGSQYYRDPSGQACSLYGKPCSYLPLCEVHPVEWPDIIEKKYEVSSRDRDALEDD